MQKQKAHVRDLMLYQYRPVVALYGYTLLSCFIGFLYPLVYRKSSAISKSKNLRLLGYLFAPNLLALYSLFAHTIILAVLLLFGTKNPEILDMVSRVYKVNLLLSIIASVFFFLASFSIYKIRISIALSKLN